MSESLLAHGMSTVERAEASAGVPRAKRHAWLHAFRDYVSVLKPKETLLLGYIGAAAAIVAGGGSPPWARFAVALVAVVLGSAGANALTNYLDREVDARMVRTRRRALPSGRIRPPEMMLPLAFGLVGSGLIIAWFLEPWAFAVGLGGTFVAVIWRKTWVTHILGGLSGCAPVAVGYLAISGAFDLRLLFICLLILVWVPVHVWSVMIACRDDYLQAGVRMFPATWPVIAAVKVLLALAVVLLGVSVGLYLADGLGLVYLLPALALGLAMVAANYRVVSTGARDDAWRVYKLSAYPYLGLIFLAMCLDLWV